MGPNAESAWIGIRARIIFLPCSSKQDAAPIIQHIGMQFYTN